MENSIHRKEEEVTTHFSASLCRKDKPNNESDQLSVGCGLQMSGKGEAGGQSSRNEEGGAVLCLSFCRAFAVTTVMFPAPAK